MSASDVEVVIIGGGHAGLSAALVLGRSLRRVVVIDSGKYRNRFADVMHNVIALDGTEIADVRKKSLTDIAQYKTVRVVTGTVRRIAEQTDPTVEVEYETEGNKATVTARKLLLATGLEDVLPSEPRGLDSLWGHGLYHCPYCHGFEVANLNIGFLAISYSPTAGAAAIISQELSGVEPVPLDGNTTTFQLIQLYQLTKSLSVFTNGATNFFSPPQLEAFKRNGVKLVEDKIDSVGKSGDGTEHAVTVKFAGENSVTVDALFGRFPYRHAPVIAPLKLKVHPGMRTIEIDQFGRTSAKNVSAAGDCVEVRAQVSVAVSLGTLAGIGLNIDLATETWNKKS